MQYINASGKPPFRTSFIQTDATNDDNLDWSRFAHEYAVSSRVLRSNIPFKENVIRLAAIKSINSLIARFKHKYTHTASLCRKLNHRNRYRRNVYNTHTHRHTSRRGRGLGRQLPFYFIGMLHISHTNPNQCIWLDIHCKYPQHCMQDQRWSLNDFKQTAAKNSLRFFSYFLCVLLMQCGVKTDLSTQYFRCQYHGLLVAIDEGYKQMKSFTSFICTNMPILLCKNLS